MSMPKKQDQKELLKIRKHFELACFLSRSWNFDLFSKSIMASIPTEKLREELATRRYKMSCPYSDCDFCNKKKR